MRVCPVGVATGGESHCLKPRLLQQWRKLLNNLKGRPATVTPVMRRFIRRVGKSVTQQCA
jgi:hypothetical protein